ncbi:MAG: dTMP kinase [Gammaproteobacteria bacterium]
MSKFIVLEGSEGVGKSTQQKLLAAFLESQGQRVLLTREPGGTALGESIRALILGQDNKKNLSPWSELFLMFAARAQHIQEVISPALAQGFWVISDRFLDSSLAYQGAGRGLPLDAISSMGSWIIPKNLEPDLVLVFDAPLELSKNRIQNRGQVLDRIEQESRDFFERVQNYFVEKTIAEPERYKRIQAAAAIDSVASEIKAILTSHFQL